MLNQPISSPMITTMLGCCGCCATTGALVAINATYDASTASPIVLIALMLLVSLNKRPTPPLGVSKRPHEMMAHIALWGNIPSFGYPFPGICWQGWLHAIRNGDCPSKRRFIADLKVL